MTKQEQAQKQQNAAFVAAQKAQIQKMHNEAELSEVKAVYWKSQVDIIKYSLEYEQLLPEYEAHQARMKEKEAEALKRFQEQLAANQAQDLVEDGSNQVGTNPVPVEPETKA